MPRCLICIGFMLGILLVGCQPPKPQLAPPEPPVVTVMYPQSKSLDALAEFTGRLAAVETQEIRAQVSGYLKAILFEEGGIVKEGQPLYEIDPEPYEAALLNAKAMVLKSQSDVTTAEKQLALANSDNNRVKNLASASQAEVDKAAATFETATSNLAAVKASVESAKAMEKKAQFDRNNCTIKCEVKGVGRVSRTEITKGNLVTAGQTVLCKIQSLDPIYAFWEVDESTSLMYRRMIYDEKKIPDPRTGKKLNCWIGTRDENRDAEGKWPHAGAVDYIATEIIRGLGPREIRAKIDNPGPNYRLGPGDSVRVQVVAGATEEQIIIPEVAIGSQQQQKFVYVVGEKDGKPIAEFRPVALGPVREIGEVRWQIIKSGITLKDRIVVNGLLRVRPGAPINPTETTAFNINAK
jgi:RND family efflux transporter MFP subunit